MRRSACLVTALLLTVLGISPAGAAPKKSLGVGEGVFRPANTGTLFQVPLDGPLTPEERAYLGLSKEGPFAIADLAPDLLVLEVFNVSCYACSLMAPVMDEVYRLVAADEGLRGRVRFLGIGAGNTLPQVRQFRERYDIPFPALPDPEFAAYDALGNTEGTPYLLLRTKGAGGAVEARYHVGHIPKPERVVEEISSALAGVPPAGAALQAAAGAAWRQLPPPLAEAELRERLVAAAAEAGLPGAAVTPVKLGDETYYRLAAGGRQLWASVAGRSKVCNVCHDIFFIVVFGDDGKVVNLAPIEITKYKNVPLDAADVAFLKGRVVGRFLTQEIVFDPEVDAVSTATMSSALVFDTLRRLREGYRALQGQGTQQR
jgi:hypothetical protein